MTSETLLVSAQSHHSIHQLNRADHTGEVAALFRLARRALQASEALEKQVTLVDVFVVESIMPVFMGFLHDSAGLPAGDTNIRYLAELNGSGFYCDDYATAQAHLDYWSKQQLHCWGRR